MRRPGLFERLARLCGPREPAMPAPTPLARRAPYARRPRIAEAAQATRGAVRGATWPVTSLCGPFDADETFQ